MAPVHLASNFSSNFSDKVYEIDGVFKLTGISVAPTKPAKGVASIVRSGQTYQCILKWPGCNYSTKRMKLTNNIKQSVQRNDQLTIVLKNDFQIIGKECNPANLKDFISILDDIQTGTIKSQAVSKGETSHDDEKENKPLGQVAFQRKREANVLHSTPIKTDKPRQGQTIKTPSLTRAHLPTTMGRILLEASQKKQALSPTTTSKDRLQSLSPPADNGLKATTFYNSSLSPLNPQPKINRPLATVDHDKVSMYRGYLFRQRERKQESSDHLSLVGFQNLGNTCYMNSILQSLLSLPTFASDLENHSALTNSQPNSLHRSLWSLLNSIRKSDSQERQKNILRRIKQKISLAANRFSGSLQHDAHEFLCQCFDQLKEEGGNQQDEPVKNEKEPSLKDDSEDDKITVCPVRRNFECLVSHTIECNRCRHKVIKDEIMHDFSLNIPDIDENKRPSGCSIEELMFDYFEEEKVEYSCEHCEGNASTLSHLFARLPRIITLHLKRYQFDTGISKNSKKLNRISIPKFLDIGGLCTNETSLPLKFVKVQTQQQSSSQKRAFISDSDDSDFGSCAKIRRRLDLHPSDKDHENSSLSQSFSAIEESPSPKSFTSTHNNRSMLFDYDPDGTCPTDVIRLKVPGEDTSDESSTFTNFLSFNDESNTDCNIERRGGGIPNDKRSRQVEGCNDLNRPLLFEPLDSKVDRCEIERLEYDDIEGTKLVSKASAAETPLRCGEGMPAFDDRDRLNITPVSLEDEEKQMQMALEMSLLEYTNEVERRERPNVCTENSRNLSKKVRKIPSNNATSRRYQLVGVINHIGSSTNVGHYTCDVFDHTTKEWRSCNDSSINTVTEHEVRYGRVHSAYILFYMFEDCCKAFQT